MWEKLMKKNRGIETIEVVIILVILVAIGFAFRNVITGWYNHLVDGVETQVFSSPGSIPNGQ
ncbi:MAG: hypothetical protein L0Y48_01930 [Fusobacteria bacterium]|nr:hypothetical protein [Fusobacteriota bacterium]